MRLVGHASSRGGSVPLPCEKEEGCHQSGTSSRSLRSLGSRDWQTTMPRDVMKNYVTLTERGICWRLGDPFTVHLRLSVVSRSSPLPSLRPPNFKGPRHYQDNQRSRRNHVLECLLNVLSVVVCCEPVADDQTTFQRNHGVERQIRRSTTGKH